MDDRLAEALDPAAPPAPVRCSGSFRGDFIPRGVGSFPSDFGEVLFAPVALDPPVVRSILLHLDLSHGPPPVALPRGPPQGDVPLDQFPGADLGAGCDRTSLLRRTSALPHVWAGDAIQLEDLIVDETRHKEEMERRLHNRKDSAGAGRGA